MAVPKTRKSSGAPVKPRIRFIRPDPESPKPTGTEKDADELRFGFWDNFMDFSAPLPGQTARLQLLNTQELETRNLCGGDSRRFYITLEDPGAAGKGFVEVDWWTAYANSDARVAGTVHDDPGSKMALIETGKSTGVFISKGLMLVNDAADRSVGVHSGISASDPLLGKAHGGVRTDKQSNYRLRRAGMFGFSVASYQSKAMKAPVTVVAPVFLPANRRLMPVQVYVVKKSKGGAPSIPVADIASVDLRVLTETYERHGIWVWTMVSSNDEAINGSSITKAGSPIEYTMLLVDPPARVKDAKVTEADMDTLAATFLGAGKSTLRLFFVEEILYTIGGHQVLGIAFSTNYKPAPNNGDSLAVNATPIAQTTLGTGFVRLGRDPYTAAHELGHLLMPKQQNGGHFSTPSGLLTSFFSPAAGTRHFHPLNLMRDGSAGQVEHAAQTKRIWDGSDDDGDSQHSSLDISGFLR
ncbi:MAG: hypothetical protein ABJE95_02790 [Byssovorax sp.]